MARTLHYGTTAKALHWLIAALLIVQFPIGWLMPDIRRGMQPGTAMTVHISLGVSVLALILVRLAWRLTHPVAPESSLPAWQRVSSEVVHWVLYALVFANTLTGWFYASMRGWHIDLFGFVALPMLTVEGSLVGRAIGRWHERLVWVLLALVAVHVIAAFVHLVVYRDRVMQRILPERLRPASR
jgi:cytochrome b561